MSRQDDLIQAVPQENPVDMDQSKGLGRSDQDHISAQPFFRSPTVSSLMWILGLFALVQLGFLGWSLAFPGEEEIFNQSYRAAELATEKKVGPIQINDAAIVRLDLDASVNQSWYGLQMALVNSEEQAVAEAYSEVAYYHGVRQVVLEGGDHGFSRFAEFIPDILEF